MFLLALGGCHRHGSPAQGPGDLSGVTGVASWYGHPFDGRQTANGEIYDMEKMTAAHRTYPFGTVVQVTNLINAKTVKVRINDRGPFVEGRVIDLSHAAAGGIEMPGVSRVRLDIVSTPRSRGVLDYAVQVGAFPARADAEALLRQINGRYGEANVIFRSGDATWRVLIGRASTMEAATTVADQVSRETGPAFVVLRDEE